MEEDKSPLGREALISIIEKYDEFLKRMGLRGRIHFTGGEPLICGDLFILLDEARKKNMPTRMLSNGTLLTRDTARALKDSGCKIVQISLDGDRQTHNAIRGEFAYEKAMEGARILKKEGISVTIMMTLSVVNHNMLKPVYDEALAGAAVDRFSFSRLVPIGRGASYRGDTLSKTQLKGLFKVGRQLKSDHRMEMPMRDPLWGPYLNSRSLSKCNPRLLSGCSIGYNGICVDTDGSVYPCRRLPLLLGNIMTDDFWKLWNDEILNLLRNRDALKGKCRKCHYRWQCGGCRAVAYAIHGDYMEEDPQCFI
ncbi:MAG: radical SAM protein [Nitrospirota bacterium]